MTGYRTKITTRAEVEQAFSLFFSLATVTAISLLLTGCKHEGAKEAEPVVPVQVTDVRRDSIQRIVSVEGILHPRDQAGIMPKISAPIRQFYVNRGAHVSKGQLVASLENRDLAAAVTDAKGT